MNTVEKIEQLLSRKKYLEGNIYNCEAAAARPNLSRTVRLRTYDSGDYSADVCPQFVRTAIEAQLATDRQELTAIDERLQRIADLLL